MIGLAMHRRKALESFFIASVIPHKYLTVCLQLWFCLDQGRKKELSLKCVSWTRLHRLSKNNFLSRHTTFIFIHNWEEKKNKNFYYHLGERWTVTMKMYKQFNQHATSQSLQVQDITSQKDKYFLYLLQNFCIIF